MHTPHMQEHAHTERMCTTQSESLSHDPIVREHWHENVRLERDGGGNGGEESGVSSSRCNIELSQKTFQQTQASRYQISSPIPQVPPELEHHIHPLGSFPFTQPFKSTSAHWQDRFLTNVSNNCGIRNRTPETAISYAMKKLHGRFWYQSFVSCCIQDIIHCFYVTPEKKQRRVSNLHQDYLDLEKA